MDVSHFLLVLGLLTFSGNNGVFCDKFTLVPLTQKNLVLQKPYNVSLKERYSFQRGVSKFWVYTDDKPFKPESETRPRTEVRIKGLDYFYGIWQFEGYVYVPKGTSGVTIMQIFGGTEGWSTAQIRIYNGEVKYYSFVTMATDMYDKWFKLNVIHDSGKGNVTIFIDGVQKLEKVARGGPGKRYFKFGVYSQPTDSSNYMESRWRDVKIYRK